MKKPGKDLMREQLERSRSRRIVLIALGVINHENRKPIVVDKEFEYGFCLKRLQFENELHLIRAHVIKRFSDDFHEAIRVTTKRKGIHGVPATIMTFHDNLIKKLGIGTWHKIVHATTMTCVMMGWIEKLSQNDRTKSHAMYEDTKKKLAENAAHWIAKQNTEFIMSMGGWSDILDYEQSKDVGIGFTVAATILAGFVVLPLFIILKIDELFK